MHSLTSEQKVVVDAVLQTTPKCNVVVNAKAGSGKSTVSIEVCAQRALAGKSTLYITFSARLKQESQRTIALQQDVELQSFVQIETIHSCLSHLFAIPCHESNDVYGILNNDLRPQNTLHHVDLLIIDEAQDIGSMLISAIQVIRSHLNTGHTVMILGDMFQVIYRRLHGADARLLTRPESILESRYEYVTCPLSTSFRISPEMSSWINTHLNPTAIRDVYPELWDIYGADIQSMWGEGIMGASRKVSSPPVTEIRCSIANMFQDDAANRVMRRWLELDPSEILLISYSVRGKHCRKILSTLHREFSSGHTHGWYVTRHSGGAVDYTVTQYKSRFSTIHSAKGLGRKYVMVVGLDSGLTDKLADSMSSTSLEYVLDAYKLAYVACTRASEELVVVSDLSNSAFFTITHRRYISPRPTPTHKVYYAHTLMEYVQYDSALSTNVEVKEVGTIDGACPFTHLRCTRQGQGGYEDISTLQQEIQRTAVRMMCNERSSSSRGGPGTPLWWAYIVTIAMRNMKRTLSAVEYHQLSTSDFRTYLDIPNHRTVLQRTIELLSSIGLPPVEYKCDLGKDITLPALYECGRPCTILLRGNITLCYRRHDVTVLVYVAYNEHVSYDIMSMTGVMHDVFSATHSYIVYPLSGKLYKIEVQPGFMLACMCAKLATTRLQLQLDEERLRHPLSPSPGSPYRTVAKRRKLGHTME